MPHQFNDLRKLYIPDSAKEIVLSRICNGDFPERLNIKWGNPTEDGSMKTISLANTLNNENKTTEEKWQALLAYLDSEATYDRHNIPFLTSLKRKLYESLIYRELENSAFDAFSNEKPDYEIAIKMYEQILSNEMHDYRDYMENLPRILSCHAACYYYQNNFDKAYSLIQKYHREYSCPIYQDVKQRVMLGFIQNMTNNSLALFKLPEKDQTFKVFLQRLRILANSDAKEDIELLEKIHRRIFPKMKNQSLAPDKIKLDVVSYLLSPSGWQQGPRFLNEGKSVYMRAMSLILTPEDKLKIKILKYQTQRAKGWNRYWFTTPKTRTKPYKLAAAKALVEALEAHQLGKDHKSFTADQLDALSQGALGKLFKDYLKIYPGDKPSVQVRKGKSPNIT